MKRLLAVFALSALVFGAYAAEVNDLNITDASNTARFPENMAPSAVNDGARALEGILARWYKDVNGSLSASGASGAYTVSANQTLTTYYDGLYIVFTANHATTGAATLNVDSLGAKTIRAVTDTDLTTNDIRAGQKVAVIYDGTNAIWQMVSPRGLSAVVGPTSSIANQIPSFSDTTGGVLKSTGITDTSLMQVGRHTIWIPGVALVSRTSTGAEVTTTELPTNRVMVKGLAFDASVNEFGQFTIAAPKSWNEGTLAAEFLWTAPSGSGTVQWYLQCLAVGDDDALDASFGSAIGLTDTLLAANDVHISSETSDITCAGTPATGDLLVFQVYRAATADSLAVDAVLLGIRLIMTTDAANDL